ncbi:MAG TPA: hypothetical protein VFJ62_11550 [Usitatibacter sp.]|nr:hypothetical protein [Usitatibacter sp.]
MKTPTPRIPAEAPFPVEPPEEAMNEVLLGLAWMLAEKVIRKAKAAAAAA